MIEKMPTLLFNVKKIHTKIYFWGFRTRAKLQGMRRFVITGIKNEHNNCFWKAKVKQGKQTMVDLDSTLMDRLMWVQIGCTTLVCNLFLVSVS